MKDSWSSDHFPLSIRYEECIYKSEHKLNKFNYKKANWKQFQDTLEDNINHTSIPVDPNSGYTYLISAFRRARDVSIPIQKGFFKHKYSPYWTPECSKAKLEKKMQKNV